MYPGDLDVDLLLGKATGFGGIAHIQDVTGSIGNDLIVGDDNPNILTGGTGRNILIGRRGADQLIGGPGDDILIAGYTDYDNDPNLTAWKAIKAEWTSGDSYQTRYSFIKSGGGLNGTYILDKTTVHSDQVKNTLTGGAGRDWFFDSFMDVITDLVTNGTDKEHVTPI
jgi:Ca2+-binding RTX toxin-like protein